MEKGDLNPRLDTVVKVLAPLGKTLAVVPLENADPNHEWALSICRGTNSDDKSDSDMASAKDETSIPI